MSQKDQIDVTKEQHAQAWEALARDIAALKDFVKETPEPTVPGSRVGELIIIGSGIEMLGFQMGDEALIASADKVFYCVADPATVVWIKQLRPDAYDLYVLYDDSKVRYTTYMQMAEAQLYYVRQGLKVVVIFYGHPGIFVLSTHRAILIARREGHKATMKAGVCALDCLCADLGVDPCHPGMQTHEATDMLVRQRRPDTSLHVILWQVGLIGEMGYRRNGYINQNFSVFVSYLQEFYGRDYPVTHYIASRYPTIPSLIEVLPLEALHDPDVQVKVTGLSTFYLAPKETTAANADMALTLGMMKSGQTLHRPSSPLREIGKYGPREMAAFSDFAHFTVPRGYHWQEPTAANAFLLALREDRALQELYARDPAAALADARFSNLSERERALLLSRDAGALQIAAKGIFRKSSPNHVLILDLLKHKPLAMTLLRRVQSRSPVQAKREVGRWLAAKGYAVDWRTLCGDVNAINHNYLFPWTGIYAEETQQVALTIIGSTSNSGKSVLYVNDCRIERFTFDKGKLQWQAGQGNPHNGFFHFDSDTSGNRRLIGKIWPEHELIPSRHNFTAFEVDPQRAQLSRFVRAWQQSSSLPVLAGCYVLRVTGDKLSAVDTLVIEQDTVSINGCPLQGVTFERGKLAWTGGPAHLYEGALTFIIDPITLTPEVFGEVHCRGSQSIQPCYGSGQSSIDTVQERTALAIPLWVQRYLEDISARYRQDGGIFLWHRWEKHNFTSRVVKKVLTELG